MLIYNIILYNSNKKVFDGSGTATESAIALKKDLRSSWKQQNTLEAFQNEFN